MAIWSVARQDPLWDQVSCTRPCRRCTATMGRAPGYLAFRNQAPGNNQGACCCTKTPRPRGCMARDESSRCPESQEVLLLNNFCKPGWVGGDLAARDLDVEEGHPASKSKWSLGDDPDARRPEGYEMDVTPVSVSKLCREGFLAEAVEALGVLAQTDCFVDKGLFYTVLKGCVVNRELVLGRRVHALTVKKGYQSDTFLCNHILRMYSWHGRLQDAMDVFTMVHEPDAFMWSSIIYAHVKDGKDKQAIQLYHEMRRSSVKPDGHVFVAALQACAKGSDLETGKQVHADVLAGVVEPHLFVCNSLVDMYAKCGSLEDAQRVFDRLGQKDVVTWTSLIAGYTQQGMDQEALRLYSMMEEDGITVPNAVTFVCLLQACASVGSRALETGKELHAQIRERGHHADVLVANSLVHMYIKCGSLEDAQRLFDGLIKKDVVTWTALIAGYSQQGMGKEALVLYSAMQEEGVAVPNSVTFLFLLQACAAVGTPALDKGKLLHTQIREGGHEADVLIANCLVNMYAKCGSLDDTEKVFNGLGNKDVVTWNTMISLYSQQGKSQEALLLFRSMQEDSITAPDSVTFVCLLQACGHVGPLALDKGKQIHLQIRELGYQADVFVGSSLVSMYAKCGSLEDAQKVFDELAEKNVVTWNSMIAAYAQQGMGQEALRVYNVMQEDGMVVPNAETFVSLLQACASEGNPALEKGKQLHEQIRGRELQAHVVVANSLVNMYAKCGSLKDAQTVFDALGARSVVTWNAMISGYSRQGNGQEALRLYSDMQADGISVPDSVTFACLLQACATGAALHLGRQLHAQIEVQGLECDVFIARSLINMYSKCGSMDEAQQVFEALPERNVFSWNALIAGYSSQGDSEGVFNLLLKMREDGVQPNGITFLCVLTVCSHRGLVNKGRQYFEGMITFYGIAPTVEHYTCMVDLLGRAGRLDEGLALVKSMPVVPDAAIWQTLLGACRKWGNVEVGRWAFNEAVKLDKKDAAAYLLMSSIYTGAQMWEQAQATQAKRIGISAWKQPGQSWWTDMDGLVHSFVVGNQKYPDSRALLK